MIDRSPSTEAGRALLAYSKGLPTPFITPTWLEGILAIEAEARAPLREALLDAFREAKARIAVSHEAPPARAPLDDHLTARDQHRLACGTCGKRLRDHIEGVTGHPFVRTFAPARAPLDVDRLRTALYVVAVTHTWSNAAAIALATETAREYAALEEPTE